MSYLFQVAHAQFEGHRRNAGEIDLGIAMNEIDMRSLEVAELIVAARDMVLYHAQDFSSDAVASLLNATLALLVQMAQPYDVVHGEIDRLLKIAARAQLAASGQASA